jgi:hypothetical protein
MSHSLLVSDKELAGKSTRIDTALPPQLHATTIDEKIQKRRSMKDADSEDSDAGEEDGSEMEDGGSSDEAETPVPLSKQKYGTYADTESESEGESDEAEEMAQDAESEDEAAALAEKEKKVFFFYWNGPWRVHFCFCLFFIKYLLL